jgi:hypothetical protein
MPDTANRKRIKTREKVISFIQKNDEIISIYGSIEALKIQFNLYRASRCNESRPAYNDYKAFIRRKIFIENNFHVYSAATTTVEAIVNETESGITINDENINNSTNDETEDVNHDTRVDAVSPNNINQSNCNNNRGRQNEIFLHEESLNLKCHNCRRKQCRNLLNQYGSVFRMEMYRYGFIYMVFKINTTIHFLICLFVLLGAVRFMCIVIANLNLCKALMMKLMQLISWFAENATIT